MNEIVAFAKRKVGPAPIWVYLVIGILGLAWYLRSRKKKTAEEETKDDSTGVLSQFALAYPMPYTSDTFVNVTGGNTPHSNTPTTVTAKEGTWLSNFLASVNQKYPGLGLTEAKLRELNPGLNIIPANKFGYISDSNPSGRAGGGPDVLVLNTGGPSTQVRIQ